MSYGEHNANVYMASYESGYHVPLGYAEDIMFTIHYFRLPAIPANATLLMINQYVTMTMTTDPLQVAVSMKKGMIQKNNRYN